MSFSSFNTISSSNLFNSKSVIQFTGFNSVNLSSNIYGTINFISIKLLFLLVLNYYCCVVNVKILL